MVDYWEYPVNQVTKKEPINPRDDLAYPKVTLCNISPLRSMRNDTVTLRDSPFFGMNMEEILQEWIHAGGKLKDCRDNCSEEDKELLARIREELMGNLGLHQFAGHHVAKLFGPRREEFIVSCGLLFSKGMVRVNYPCRGAENMTLTFSPTMSNCFTSGKNFGRILAESDQGLPTGITFILFLDNMRVYNDTIVPFSDAIDMSTVGAHLQLSFAYQKPLLSQEAIMMSPGTYVCEA